MLRLYCTDATTRSAIRKRILHVTGVFFGGGGMQMTSHLHQAPRFRMSGAIPIRPLYTFTAWIGISLPPKSSLFFVGCHAVTMPIGLCGLPMSLSLGQAHIRLNAASRVKKTYRMPHINSPPPTATTLTLKLGGVPYLWARFAKRAHSSRQIYKFISLHLSLPLAAIFYVSSLQEALTFNVCTALTRYKTTHSNITDPHAQDTTEHKPNIFLIRVHQRGLPFHLRHHSQGQNCSREATTVETSRF